MSTAAYRSTRFDGVETRVCKRTYRVAVTTTAGLEDFAIPSLDFRGDRIDGRLFRGMESVANGHNYRDRIEKVPAQVWSDA